MVIFSHGYLGDDLEAEGLELNSQKDYSFVRDNIYGWQLHFLLLIIHGPLQEWFLRD